MREWSVTKKIVAGEKLQYKNKNKIYVKFENLKNRNKTQAGKAVVLLTDVIAKKLIGKVK